jgi:AhpD family alkylhydroperoxidase
MLMSRTEVESDIREMFGTVPTFLADLPDFYLESEWESMKSLQFGETAIPNKFKELIGLGVSGATRCRYCVYFHTEAARLFGATDEEINEAALIAKNTMGWSTYLNAKGYDWDEFKREFDEAMDHVRSQMSAGVPA